MSRQPPESLPRAIGRRLAGLRDRAGLSQSEVARQARTSQPYINQIEAGQRTPSVEVLVRLADAVGARPCELLRDDLPDEAA